MKKFFYVVVSLAVVGIFSCQAQVRVSVGLNPSTISLGEVSQLIIQVEGASNAEAAIPPVSGLEIINASQESSTTMVNGAVTQGTTITYQVLAQKAGVFTIPSFAVVIEGQTAQTPELKLSVTMAGYLPPKQPSSYLTPKANPSTSTVPPPNHYPSEPVFFQLITPKTKVYVGETIPVTLKLYAREGYPVQLHSLPALSGQAFTLNKLSREPRQEVQEVDGIPYHIVIWNTALSAVQAGDYPLNAEMELGVPEQRRNSDETDPFFAMFHQPREVIRKFSSELETWKVLPIPIQGSPSGFKGAVGDFSVSAKAQPMQVVTGEPVTLTITVQGQGNFDRVNPPALESTDGLKVYPPSSQFQASDESGVSGKKIFEQAIIPQKADLKSLPPLSFTFFNPELKQFVTRRIAAPAITIIPSPAGAPTVAASTPATSTSVPPPAGEVKVDTGGLLPNKVELGPLVATLNSSPLTPLLIILQTLPITALILGAIAARRKYRLRYDTDYVHQQEINRVMTQELGLMKDAVAQNSPANFFSHARRALQYQLGEKWSVKPEEINLHEIQRRDPALATRLETVFNLADEFLYSGTWAASVELKEWDQFVRIQLKELAS